jgi:energy-coupling factor transport system ATP-binding protein
MADLVANALTLVGLDPDHFSSRSPFSLSYGEARRAGLAAMLSWKPDVLVLDEPTAGLDHEGERTIVELMRILRADGRTLVIISHDVDMALEGCDRAGLLSDGQFARVGSTRDIVSDDLLTGVGLAMPEVTQVMRLLHARGWPVPACATSTGEAAGSIMNSL